MRYNARQITKLSRWRKVFTKRYTPAQIADFKLLEHMGFVQFRPVAPEFPAQFRIIFDGTHIIGYITLFQLVAGQGGYYGDQTPI